MAASHRDETPDSQSSLRDEHYNNEQSSRRRRLNSLPRPRMPHYPGDGLDFRRPVMSSSVNERERESEGRSEPVVIDLTDEDATQTSQRSDRLNIPLRGSSRGERAAAGSSRAQRFPRWGHALIDSNSDSSDDEEEDNNNFNQLHLPGAGHQGKQIYGWQGFCDYTIARHCSHRSRHSGCSPIDTLPFSPCCFIYETCADPTSIYSSARQPSSSVLTFTKTCTYYSITTTSYGRRRNRTYSSTGSTSSTTHGG